MPQDFAISEGRDVQRDGTGDWDTVTGAEYARQRMAIVGGSIIKNAGGGGLTAETVEEVRASVENELSNLDIVTSPVTVRVTSIDGTRIELNARTDTLDLTQRV